MLAAEVLAKGGGTPGSPSGRINEVIVDGLWFNPSARAYMRYRIQMDRMRSIPNMSKVEQRKFRKIKELCMDTCKETLASFTNGQAWVSAGGILTAVGQSMLENKTKRQLKRKGLA